MRKGLTGCGLILMLTLTGCATATGGATPADPSDSQTRCDTGHRAPSTVAVVVYLDAAGEVQVVPDTVVLEHQNQTLIWTAADGEISNITFAASDCAPGPPAINRRGRQLSTRVAPGHKGAHKYSFTFHPTSGPSRPVDPLIVVEY